MNASFLLLLLTAGILRFLGDDAKKNFDGRLARLLPRKILENHLQALFREYPQHFAEFRRRVLPFFALHIAFNAAACATVIFALWFTPPAALLPLSLSLIRWGAVIVVPVAFLGDLVILARLLISTRPLALDEAGPEA